MPLTIFFCPFLMLCKNHSVAIAMLLLPFVMRRYSATVGSNSLPCEVFVYHLEVFDVLSWNTIYYVISVTIVWINKNYLLTRLSVILPKIEQSLYESMMYS